MRFLSLFILVVLLGCQTPPKTAVKQVHTDPGKYSDLVTKNKKRIRLTEKTVVLDVRSQFDFQVARLPRSISLSWTDFVGKKDMRLKRSQRPQIRRLALRGVDKDTPIIVVGYGKKGQGEEGRLAWTLLHLGYEDVQFASVDVFSKQLSANNTTDWEAKSVKVPELNEVESLYLDRANLEAELVTPSEKREFAIIDVRSQSEFIKQSKTPGFQDYQAVNIQWKEFLRESGRPNITIRRILKPLQIDKKTKIYVISDNGLRSGAVASALYLMGYKYVSNLDGGLINTKR